MILNLPLREGNVMGGLKGGRGESVAASKKKARRFTPGSIEVGQADQPVIFLVPTRGL